MCLFAVTASAGITRISPAQFDVGVEDFINIYGSSLLGSTATIVVFDGVHAVEPSFAGSDHLIVFVPTPVVYQEGEHTLVVRSIDGTAVRTHGPVTFTVRAPVVDPGGPPLLSLPEFVVEEATSPNGAVVTLDASAYDASGPVPVTCTPASGSTFRFGVTNVTCSATNTAGTSSGSFQVNVTDTTPPVLTVPDHIITDDAVVTFTVTATDNLGGTITPACSPASGSTFPQGTTRVRCRAIDASQNLGVDSFLVTVTGGPPVLILPEDVVEEATGPNGAVATYVATSADGTPVTCAPASGSTFPLGTTVVTCTAGVSTGTFNVTVADTTGPVITAPSLLEVEATSPAGAVAVYVATAHDLVDGDVAVTCAPASGSQFPLGDTDVFCTAFDRRGNGNTASFRVTVADTTAPVVTSISATPNVLWPPDHKMVDVTVSVTMVDATDPSPTAKIVSVSSNQPTEGTGDGDRPIDWVITGPSTLQLRSEWSQGKERTYTITVETRDALGNAGTATVTVKVTNARRRSVVH